MKKTKVIIPALGILLLSTAASVTGTVAWFTTNNKVTADSMKIKAIVGGNLNIALGSNLAISGVNDLSVNVNSTHTTLNPVTIAPSWTVDAESHSVAADGGVMSQIPATWATSQEPTAGTPGQAATYSNVGLITSTGQADATKNYVAFGAISLANKGEPGQSIAVTPKCVVEDTGLENDLSGALRAAFVMSQSTQCEGTFTPTYNATNVIDPVKRNIGTEEDPVYLLDLTFANITLENNIAYNLGLMVWYEGTDADCYVNNAINVQQVVANWEFQAVAA